jgi:hypothetical protein
MRRQPFEEASRYPVSRDGFGIQWQLDGCAESSKSIRSDDHRRGADHHDDGLKPDRHTLTYPRAHPAYLIQKPLKTGQTFYR